MPAGPGRLMRPAWRLAINSLSARRSRTALLVIAVALSSALIAAVACAMASANLAIAAQIGQTLGDADVRLKPAGSGKTMPTAMLDRAAAWPGVEAAAGRLTGALSLRVRKPLLQPRGDGSFERRDAALVANAQGNAVVLPGKLGETSAAADGPLKSLAPPPELVAGRLAIGADEIVLDAVLAERLSGAALTPGGFSSGFLPASTERFRRAPGGTPELPLIVADKEEAKRLNAGQGVEIGDEVEVVRQLLPGPTGRLALALGRTQRLRVVGIAAQPPLGGKPGCYLPLATLAALTDQPGLLSEIDLKLRPGADAEAFVKERGPGVGPNMLMQTTAKITAGLDRNVKSSQLGFVLATVMAFLCSSFIILTGLSTAVTERQRELAVLRCIGATRRQLGAAQVCIGVVIGAIGGAVGVPLGVLCAWVLSRVFSDALRAGLAVPPSGLLVAAIGAVAAGAAGGLYPAWRAWRQSPLEGLGARAEVPRRRGVAAVGIIGAAGVLLQLALVGLPSDGQVIFWGYATAGLPAMFVGYFLLGVPTTMLAAALLGGPLSRLLGLPRRMLRRSIFATPYGHGLTAGALMAGLAMMVALWTHGGAVLRDWIGKINFPDAFVTGLNLTEESRAKIDRLPFVRGTVPITLHPVETDIFGVRALQKYKTTFIAFEPRSFLSMTGLTWVQGDPETAVRRLEQGGAVVVAREFLIARGLGVGHKFTCVQDGVSYDFEIVGVVSSPGIEVVSKFFDVGEEYTDQALHAVFGSRKDLKEKFHSDAIHLIQIDLADGTDDATAIAAIRQELFGAGVLDAGSGRRVKEDIRSFVGGVLIVVSTIAVFVMFMASFGVANLVIARVQARQFEFGVLRAVGAQRGTVARLVIAEALVIALAACVLGTLMGVQGSWAGMRLDRLLLGLDVRLRPPIGPIAAGWGILVLMTLAAAWPAVWRLNHRKPRELLGAMRG